MKESVLNMFDSGFAFINNYRKNIEPDFGIYLIAIQKFLGRFFY